MIWFLLGVIGIVIFCLFSRSTNAPRRSVFRLPIIQRGFTHVEAGHKRTRCVEFVFSGSSVISPSGYFQVGLPRVSVRNVRIQVTGDHQFIRLAKIQQTELFADFSPAAGEKELLHRILQSDKCRFTVSLEMKGVVPKLNNSVWDAVSLSHFITE